MRSAWVRLRRQNGLTLAEVLVSTAILVMVITLTTSVLISVTASHDRMLKQTEKVESLRVAAAVITQDIRQAITCESSVTYLRLVREWNGSGSAPKEWVEYKFKARLANGQEVDDPDHLHRWHYSEVNPGEYQVVEYLVGWELAPPRVQGRVVRGTKFSCADDIRSAGILLEKKADSGGGAPLSLQVYAHQRNG